MITEQTLSQHARDLQILECEAWFEVTERIAKQQGLWAEHESRVQKSARLKHPKSGKRLGRIWINYSGLVSYELASRLAWSTFVAGTISDALGAIANQVEF